MHTNAFSVVGEVCPLVSKSGSTNGNSLSGSSRRVIASIGIVISGGNSKVEAHHDSGINSLVQCG